MDIISNDSYSIISVDSDIESIESKLIDSDVYVTNLENYNMIASGIQGNYCHVPCNDIMDDIDNTQHKLNIIGDILEIGSHQGKSLIPLACLCRRELNEQCTALDAYIGPHFHKFMLNLKACFTDTKFINIKMVKNRKITQNDIKITSKYKYRICRINPINNRPIMWNNLEICKNMMYDSGVIILSEYFHKNYKFQKEAVEIFIKRYDYVPFYASGEIEEKNNTITRLGYGLLMLCKREYFENYHSQFIGRFYNLIE